MKRLQLAMNLTHVKSVCMFLFLWTMFENNLVEGKEADGEHAVTLGQILCIRSINIMMTRITTSKSIDVVI